MQKSPIRKPLSTAIMLVLAGSSGIAAAGNTSSVTMDAVGNSVVAWQDNTGIDGDAGGIFAQRYDANGVPLGSAAFQVNTSTPGVQQSPASAMAANGAFVVVWQGIDEGGDGGIYAQRFAADASVAGGEFRVNAFTAGEQRNPTVAMNANGDFVVAWEDALGDGSGFGITARTYLADGTALTDAVAVNTTGAGDQLSPSVAMAANGAFAVSWFDAKGAVQMQRFDSNGVAVGSETTVAAAGIVSAKGLLPVGVLSAGVDLGLNMTSSNSGNSVTYNVKVINYGDTPSGAVSLIDTLPGGTSFVSAAGSGWSCNNNTPSAGKVTCNLASIGAGTNSTVAINVDATGASSTSLTNSAAVSTSGDTNVANNTASKTVTTTGSSGGAEAGSFSWLFGVLLGFFGLRRRFR
jgi:uncharacterized repeat protein (TIGR01451 family)